jgi:hypothetical protein
MPFKASYRPANGSEIGIGGANEKVVFSPISLTKPLDTGSVAIYSALFLLGSIVLTLGSLLVGTNLQRRLPDPSRFRLVSVPVAILDGQIIRGGDPIKMNDFEALNGDRSGYRLPDGVRVARSFTFNPFADPVATVRTRSGVLAVQPAVTKGLQTSHRVPARFDQLSALVVDSITGTGSITSLVQSGSKPEVSEESISKILDSASRDFQKLQPESKKSGNTSRVADAQTAESSNSGNSEGSASSGKTTKGLSAPPRGGSL